MHQDSTIPFLHIIYLSTTYMDICRKLFITAKAQKEKKKPLSFNWGANNQKCDIAKIITVLSRKDTNRKQTRTEGG